MREERTAVLMFERQVVVRLDENGRSVTYPDGTIQAIAWSLVERLAIEQTTADLGMRMLGGFLREKESVALTRKAQLARMKPRRRQQRYSNGCSGASGLSASRRSIGHPAAELLRCDRYAAITVSC